MERKGSPNKAKMESPFTMLVAYGGGWMASAEDGSTGKSSFPSVHFYFSYMSIETDCSQVPCEERHRTVGETVSGFADLA